MNNRPTKFRVWDIKYNQWSEIYSYVFQAKLYLNEIFTQKRYIFQQYTGSLDKTKKQIFEGDVVLWHTEDHFEGGYSYKKMVVGWNQRCMQFRLFEFPNQVGKAAGETFWAEDVRVIGHVFDYENEECRYHLDESVKNLRKVLVENHE